MKKLIPFVMICSVLTACGADGSNPDSKENHKAGVRNSAIQNRDRLTSQQVSRRLEDLALRNPNVNKAAAVVLGAYAIVGIDIDDDIERSQTGSIKYAVGESLENDPQGGRAMVVADPDITARLRELSQDIKDGRPLPGIMNELGNIAGRLIPTVPGDKNDNEPYKTTEEPKKQMNRQEKKIMEKEQDEQSNHYKDRDR
ncbi:YhcN/YlaJ family sporulation lipoprotein [Peribacillus sp. SCS-37]|uniref:YhcN/YlaJ family sporulation lipoprotein n=1 Tax=Paraperibacillus esterisolvens TaxID=3115296 RepID=UPI003906AB84